MNIPVEILLFVLSCFLGAISYFLNRILSQMNDLVKNHHRLNTIVALNTSEIDHLKKNFNQSTMLRNALDV